MPRKVKQVIADIYKQFNPTMNPVIVMNFDVEDFNADVNVTPDKREIFLKNENEILEELRVKINEFFENIQRVKAYDVGRAQ